MPNRAILSTLFHATQNHTRHSFNFQHLLMKTPNGSPVSSSSPKPRQLRNREQTSRFLPSSPPTSTTNSGESHSPLRRKSSSPGRRHVITEDPGLTRHQLWPATTKKNSGTLADHITEDRIIENTNNASKENDKPLIGVSTRHVARLDSPSSSSSNKKQQVYSIVPARLSLDENTSSNKTFSSRRNRNSVDSDSDAGTPTSRKDADVEVQLQPSSDAMALRRGSRRGTSDSNVANYTNGGDSSSGLKRFTLKNAMKRANSLTGYKSSKSSWALSPGRSEAPAMSVESMDKPMSFSSFKYSAAAATATAPTKVKGVEKLLNMGFDLFKTKKTSGGGFTSSSSSPVGFGVYNSEVAHKLRLLDNRFIQWRFANARAHTVNQNISHKAESNLICVWDGLTKLQHSVLKKKIQFAKEKLEMKIAFVLYSQMKLLEAWGGMERQHLQAITAIKECLHSVVCRVPLLEGATVNMQSTSVALRHASDITASIKSILTDFSSSEVDKIAAMLSELANVVAQEKQLLEEFYDLFQTLCVFELQERSVKCNLVQLEGWQHKYQIQQLLPEISS